MRVLNVVNALKTDDLVVQAVDVAINAAGIVAGFYVSAHTNLSPLAAGVAGLLLAVVGTAVAEENEYVGMFVTAVGVGLVADAVLGGLIGKVLKYRDVISKAVEVLEEGKTIGYEIASNSWTPIK